jgi:hypothetical protein
MFFAMQSSEIGKKNSKLMQILSNLCAANGVCFGLGEGKKNYKKLKKIMMLFFGMKRNQI